MNRSITIKAAITMALFSFIIIGSLQFIFQNTQAKIAHNESLALQQRLTAVLSHIHYDNDIVNDSLAIQDNRIYLVRRLGHIIAVIIKTTSAKAYNGKISLLIAFNPSGHILGVEVLKHQETPGLGDKIESKKSNWLKQFRGYSLTDMLTDSWAVKRDGGRFDQFTGATITPRAVIQALKQTGIFLQTQQHIIFQ